MSRRKQIDKSRVKQTYTASVYKFEHLVSENEGFTLKSATLVKRSISLHCVARYCEYYTVHRFNRYWINNIIISFIF